MKPIHLFLLAATAILVAGCASAEFAANKQKVTRYEPKLEKKANGLYYAAGQDKPHTGTHTAWYANGELAWVGHMKGGVRHGEYTQWRAVKDLLHVKGQYKDGERDGDWGQWYFNGHKEMTSTYTKGKAGNIVYYSEDGEVIPHSVYLAKLHRQINKDRRQSDWLQSAGDSQGTMGYLGGGGGGFDGGSIGLPGGGSASDYHNSTIGK